MRRTSAPPRGGWDGDKQRRNPRAQVPPPWLARRRKRRRARGPPAWRGLEGGARRLLPCLGGSGPRALGACWRRGGLRVRAPATYARPGAYLPRPHRARWPRGGACRRARQPWHLTTTPRRARGQTAHAAAPRRPPSSLGKMTSHMRVRLARSPPAQRVAARCPLPPAGILLAAGTVLGLPVHFARGLRALPIDRLPRNPAVNAAVNHAV